MIQNICNLILAAILIFGVVGFTCSQELSSTLIERIENEITIVFDSSRKAGEKLDVEEISENVNDSLRAGFIDNGFYFRSFEELMVGFKSGIRGLESQKMEVDIQKITVLSENSVLLTASGDYSTKVVDGRILTGRFAWTFVYSKVGGHWKVIHSHMSNPN